MKKILFSILLLIMVVSLVVSGCSRSSGETEKSDAEIVAATATVQANLASIPTDVPIRADGEDFKFAAANTSITYQVLGDVDTITNYYRTELEAQGWEKRGKSPETPLGGAITLLRIKPDKNISVTIQSIPESDHVRVLITLILK